MLALVCSEKPRSLYILGLLSRLELCTLQGEQVLLLVQLLLQLVEVLLLMLQIVARRTGVNVMILKNAFFTQNIVDFGSNNSNFGPDCTIY
jgi:hypothetical protein